MQGTLLKAFEGRNDKAETIDPDKSSFDPMKHFATNEAATMAHHGNYDKNPIVRAKWNIYFYTLMNPCQHITWVLIIYLLVDKGDLVTS